MRTPGSRRRGHAARTRTPSPGTSPGSSRSLPACTATDQDDRIAAVETGGQPDLHSFTRGLEHDHDAARNGLALP